MSNAPKRIWAEPGMPGYLDEPNGLYTVEYVRADRVKELEFDVRSWPYFPIVMPLKEGKGPATDIECDEITFEVWDNFYNSFGSFKYLPDAINEAMRLTKEKHNENTRTS